MSSSINIHRITDIKIERDKSGTVEGAYGQTVNYTTLTIEAKDEGGHETTITLFSSHPNGFDDILIEDAE